MLLISEAAAQRILNYLVQQPYHEVHHLVDSLMKLSPQAQDAGAVSKLEVSGTNEASTNEGGTGNGRS